VLSTKDTNVTQSLVIATAFYREPIRHNTDTNPLTRWLAVLRYLEVVSCEIIAKPCR